MPAADLLDKTTRLQRNIETVFIGKPEAVRLVLVGLFAGGHVLIEDVPGVGKTTLARALARSVRSSFRRIQFTPDLLPTDILGVPIYHEAEDRFVFKPGPIFANVVLADEINRTTPRTQSSLLEAMNEFQVSVDGATHALPRPFIVLATQNPHEFEGTFVRAVRVDDSVADYVLEIVSRTRGAAELEIGVSPRGGLSLSRAAQALALLEGRDYVLPDDVKRLAVAVLAHRVIRRPGLALGKGKGERDIVREIVNATPVPV